LFSGRSKLCAENDALSPKGTKESSDDVIQAEDLRGKEPAANQFQQERRSVLE
jgi:hypothetical protein